MDNSKWEWQTCKPLKTRTIGKSLYQQARKRFLEQDIQNVNHSGKKSDTFNKIQFRNCYPSKDTIFKRTSTNWRKMFVIHMLILI